MFDKSIYTVTDKLYLQFFLLTVVLVIFSGCGIQNRLLYFPNYTLPTAKELNALQLKAWPSASMADYRCLITSREENSTKGTVVVFHGNCGTAVNRVFYMQTLTVLGYRVLLAEYPRYGGRKGDLGEKAFVGDALETVQLALTQFGEPIFILGESLGCGVASAVAADPSINIEGIVLVTPWDTLTAIAQSKFPWFPIKIFLTDTYNNIENLRLFPGRIAVIGAERDEVVPVNHAKNLYRVLVTHNKHMWLMENAGHNNVLFYTDQALWKDIMDFVGGRVSE